ncbi:GNAT family N-acetyltransferase [Flagellimonas nanhaiensis]|uniref:GNAT family N-acetyltransferase n=1 Tax=Flagellimonas nanhaiensis TaxID=2292706 RepID=A0A371JSZ2_9FLAO|nr:GNAT family N-acetyltransferase [Allomuricauda nanhaiensis]RDY60942.1 GNAT family N-acetyltransferase [Allomuricauda nanhaiensis]
MNNTITLEVVTTSSMDSYIEVGKNSYVQHYLHLWENNDPTPYISSSFAIEVVEKDLSNPNMVHFLVKMEDEVVGIVKLIKDHPLDEFSEKEALLAQKIYLLQAYSGKGVGKKVLQLIEEFAQNLGKKIVWLDTMQKGSPINFYQKNGYTIKRESTLSLPGAKPEERPMWVLTKVL